MARTLKNSFLHWTRALHTYLTMLALILLIFFSVTGFALNHPDWFGLDDYAEINRVAAAPLPAKLITDRGGIGTEHGYQLEAYLRQNEGARGELKSLDDMDDVMVVHFQGAGTKMEYSINRTPPSSSGGNAAISDAKPLGQIDVHCEMHQTMAVLGDLHRGIGTGGQWRLLIDAAAIFLMFASLSGVILWISMPKRRKLGIIALSAGIIICLGCWLFLLA